MSKWIRGIYNATANFNMSNALRSASGRILGGNSKHVREESVKSNKCEQSCQPCKSNKSIEHASTCHRNRGSCCSSGNHCPVNECRNADKTGNIPVHVNGCICSLCRDYNEYNEYSASIRTEGQGAGARIRVGNELKSFKHTNNGTADDVEHITGIQSGVAI